MDKQPILLLHGAIGSNKQLRALQESLSAYYEVHTPNLPGHGGEEFPIEFSIPVFAGFVKDYIEKNKLQQPAIFGYSMGGYIACYLAVMHPGIISRIITLATKFHWTEAIAANEVRMLQPDILEQKVPKFAEMLSQLHAPQDWKTVLRKTAGLMLALGSNPLLTPEDYAKLNIPCLLLAGDRDKMVSIEEPVSVYRALPHAEFSVLPGTPHAIELAPVNLLVQLIHKMNQQIL